MKRELPPKLHFKHGAYYYLQKRPTGGGYTWKKLARDQEEALRKYAALEGAGLCDHLEAAPQAWLIHYVGALHARTKRRATENNVYFNLTLQDVLELGEKTNWRCELTGLRFNLDRTENARARALAPSLDRVRPSGGYAKGNVRLVCVVVNMALNEWGENMFRLIASAYCRKHRIVLQKIDTRLDKWRDAKAVPPPSENNRHDL